MIVRSVFYILEALCQDKWERRSLSQNMQKHRIFIAINLPEKVKDMLADYQKKFEWEGTEWAKWTKKENLHITLEFIGNVFDKDLPAVFQKAQDFASKTPAFTVKLDKINYFPDNNLPKYIFVTGKNYENSSRSLHVTLARIKEWQWRKINPDERPNVEEDIDLSFEVKSIEVMESVLKRSGSKYRILRSYLLSS